MSTVRKTCKPCEVERAKRIQVNSPNFPADFKCRHTGTTLENMYPFRYERDIVCPRCDREVLTIVIVFAADRFSYRGGCGHSWSPVKRWLDKREKFAA